MLATTQPEDIPRPSDRVASTSASGRWRFEEIFGQLRSLVDQEKIEADDDALALLSEAGDGSMRDALSICDQAIDSSSGRLTSEQYRQLVGAGAVGVLEEMMQAGWRPPGARARRFCVLPTG